MLQFLPCFVALLALSHAEKQDSQKPLTDSPSAPFDSDFDTLVQETLKHLHVPGLSIAVIDGNQTYAKVVLNSFSGAHPHYLTILQ